MRYRKCSSSQYLCCGFVCVGPHPPPGHELEIRHCSLNSELVVSFLSLIHRRNISQIHTHPAYLSLAIYLI